MVTSAVNSALITGGGSGIGFATAALLHRAGWQVTIVGRRGDVLDDAARSLTADGGPPVVPLVADLADPDAATAIVATHVARTGGIDALVAGAGAYEPAPLGSLTARQWDATLDVHVRSVVLTAAASARGCSRPGTPASSRW